MMQYKLHIFLTRKIPTSELFALVDFVDVRNFFLFSNNEKNIENVSFSTLIFPQRTAE